jgi:hypothetical protein
MGASDRQQAELFHFLNLAKSSETPILRQHVIPETCTTSAKLHSILQT